MPPLSAILSFIKKALSVFGIFIALGLQIGMLLAIPIGLLYVLFKSIFESDPSAEYLSMALVAGQVVLIIGGIFGAIYIAAYMVSRFMAARLILSAIGYFLLALIVIGALVQCVSGDQQECRESRYVAC